MANLINDALFSALKHSITGKPLNRELFEQLTLEDWGLLHQLSREQGVLAIVFNALEDVQLMIPTKLRLKWALGSLQIENRFYKQERLANEICAEYSRYDIKPIVLKGFALSRYYPVPAHRECGDFDCYLLGEFERGNTIAQKVGAKVRFDDYKHSHINYKGLMIENHKFCTAIRGPKINKHFEKYLQELLLDNNYGTTPLNGGLIYSPSPTFNALFLLKHTMVHFLYEGIKIRHLLDWAYLISNEKENINWDIVEHWCNLLNLSKFVAMLNETIDRCFELRLPNIGAIIDSATVNRFITDILYSDTSIYKNQYASIWHQRYAILRNIVSSRWKFSKVYEKSLIIELFKSSISAIFEKRPRL